MDFSIVIPVYNSSNSLREIVARIDGVFDGMGTRHYEVIFIDDCSPNSETWDSLIALAENNPKVQVHRLMRNFGKAGAVLCGFERASGEYVITMDDDLQHRPEDIPILLTKKSHDVVMGNFPQKKHSIVARIGSKVKSWFDYVILAKPHHIEMSPYKMFKKQIVKEMLNIQTHHPFIPALMYFVTKDVVNVKITHDSRKFGKTGYTFRKRVAQFFRLLINNSSLLLKSVAMLGFGISFLSGIYAALLVYKKIAFEVSISGWTSLMVVLLILGGLILFSLGVVGEYLIRIINGLEHRPAFIVRQSVNAGCKES